MARRLMLRSREATRRTQARVIRDFDRAEGPDIAKFRALIHGFSVLLAHDKAAAEEAQAADSGGRPLAGLTYILRPLSERPETDDTDDH